MESKSTKGYRGGRNFEKENLNDFNTEITQTPGSADTERERENFQGMGYDYRSPSSTPGIVFLLLAFETWLVDEDSGFQTMPETNGVAGAWLEIVRGFCLDVGSEFLEKK
ncbi:hypothetical protein TNCV_1695101 [Trichonephila clavipes]|nr:hypothetical protein TNCV_1695101 [Trichonephila clavipes]